MGSKISLKKNVPPRFPRLCVVCEGKPDRTAAICHNTLPSIIRFLWVFSFLFGNHWTRVPVCRKCKPRLLFQRWSRSIVLMVLVIAVGLWVYWLTRDLPEIWMQGSLLAAACVVVVGFAIFETFFPQYIDTTPTGDLIDYEFRSASYAMEFAEINGSQVQEAEFH